jgi:hypothetical protein
MSIDGTYGFVYCGVEDLGIGVFTVTGDRFEGWKVKRIPHEKAAIVAARLGHLNEKALPCEQCRECLCQGLMIPGLGRYWCAFSTHLQSSRARFCPVMSAPHARLARFAHSRLRR